MAGRKGMWRWALTAAVAASVAATTGGCGSIVYRHAHGNQEEPGEAPSDGRYVLYTDLNPTPLKDPVPLKKGDPLGFRTAETGRIIAVAGEDEWTFEDAPLHWRQKD
jgi:hypothetical protein